MFLEEHADAKGFQFPDSFQAFGGISSEPGNGLHQHLIDSSFSAICKKPLKILSFLGGGTGDALIRINLNQFPSVMVSDQVMIMGLLRSKAVQLVIRIRTDTAIGGHTQSDCFRL